jgi:hypothetical protein
MDSEAARQTALLAAASAVPRGTGQAALTAYADSLIPWLTAPVTDHLNVTVMIDGRPVGRSSNGGTMAFTAIVGTNTKFDVLVTPEDAGDNATGATVNFSTDDPGGTILVPSVSADGYTWTGTLTGVTGTVNVTATCPSAPAVPPFQAQLVVQAGPTTQLVGTVTVT